MLKRVWMAGAEVAVTDGAIADLVLDYAMHLARAGTADTVALPVIEESSVHEAKVLLGPASEISISDNLDPHLEQVPLLHVDAAVEDLRRRIKTLTGDQTSTDLGTPETAFTDFGDYN